VRDRNSEIYSVRYEALQAISLNEVLKAHRRIEQRDRRIDQCDWTLAGWPTDDE